MGVSDVARAICPFKKDPSVSPIAWSSLKNASRLLVRHAHWVSDLFTDGRQNALIGTNFSQNAGTAVGPYGRWMSGRGLKNRTRKDSARSSREILQVVSIWKQGNCFQITDWRGDCVSGTTGHGVGKFYSCLDSEIHVFCKGLRAVD